MEEQMVLMIDDQPLVQEREKGELDSLDPQIESSSDDGTPLRSRNW